MIGFVVATEMTYKFITYTYSENNISINIANITTMIDLIITTTTIYQNIVTRFIFVNIVFVPTIG